jgi:hypothetical protein
MEESKQLGEPEGWPNILNENIVKKTVWTQSYPNNNIKSNDIIILNVGENHSINNNYYYEILEDIETILMVTKSNVNDYNFVFLTESMYQLDMGSSETMENINNIL